MNLLSSLSTVNWISVIVAALAGSIIGYLWYSSFLFGKAWQKEVNLTDESVKGVNIPLTYGTSIVLAFLAAIGLDIYLGPEASILWGVIKGAFIAILWVGTSLGTIYLFSQKSMKLFIIDAGYYLVMLITMGIILGAW